MLIYSAKLEIDDPQTSAHRLMGYVDQEEQFVEELLPLNMETV